MLQKLWIASRQPNGTLISLKSKAPISATTSRLQSHSSWQKWFWWLSKQRCFMLLVIPLYFPMLLTQYAPKTRIIMLLSCHFVFPCSWHNMLLRQECRVLQLISHVLGQKMKFTIHCYYSCVTIHCYYSLRIFAYLRGGCPLYLKQVFCVLSSGLLP